MTGSLVVCRSDTLVDILFLLVIVSVVHIQSHAALVVAGNLCAEAVFWNHLGELFCHDAVFIHHGTSLQTLHNVVPSLLDLPASLPCFVIAAVFQKYESLVSVLVILVCVALVFFVCHLSFFVIAELCLYAALFVVGVSVLLAWSFCPSVVLVVSVEDLLLCRTHDVRNRLLGYRALCRCVNT